MRAIALFALLGAVVPASADERPVVRVHFVFHANTCDRYGATRNAEAERFAQLVARAFANEFQFVVWRTPATQVQGETEEATLTVQFRAQDEKSGPHKGLAFYIDYFRDVEMNGSKIPDRYMSSYIGEKTALYTVHEFARPCGEDPNFTDRLRTRVESDIRVFRQDWMDNFLRYVPIAKAVPDADDAHDNAVTLGVRWKPLHAGVKSLLELNVGGDVKALLNPIDIHNADHEDPLICARVASLKDAASVTRAMIQAALQSYRSNKYIRLFMIDYELNRDTHNFRPVIRQNPD